MFGELERRGAEGGETAAELGDEVNRQRRARGRRGGGRVRVRARHERLIERYREGAHVWQPARSRHSRGERARQRRHDGVAKDGEAAEGREERRFQRRERGGRRVRGAVGGRAQQGEQLLARKEEEEALDLGAVDGLLARRGRVAGGIVDELHLPRGSAAQRTAASSPTHARELALGKGCVLPGGQSGCPWRVEGMRRNGTYWATSAKTRRSPPSAAGWRAHRRRVSFRRERQEREADGEVAADAEMEAHRLQESVVERRACEARPPPLRRRPARHRPRSSDPAAAGGGARRRIARPIHHIGLEPCSPGSSVPTLNCATARETRGSRSSSAASDEAPV